MSQACTEEFAEEPLTHSRKIDAMRKPAQKKLLRITVKRRQMEIEACLAEFGLGRGPRRLLRGKSSAGEDDHSRRLRASLMSLGPIFSHFGLYLSSRVDLLAPNYCVELSEIPDRVQATPIAAVRELMSASLGCSLDEAYAKFEDEPFESRILFQSHRALLHDGSPVTVKLMHPRLEQQDACDIELLPLLKSAFANKELTDAHIDGAIADFRLTTEQRFDFTFEARALEASFRDSKDIEMLKIPTVYKNLCSSKVLTIERSPGIRVDELVPSFDKRKDVEGSSGGGAFENLELDRAEIARNLCAVWLRQALVGRSFPVEPHAGNIVVLADGKITFTGGLFASLPSEAKTNLLNYLIAAAAQDPDKACSSLVKEMEYERAAIGEDELQYCFRQVVPFRDGGWSNDGKSDSLAEHLFVHWRLASRHGYKPQSHLLHFWRGLFLTSATARQLASYPDPLAAGLDDLRLRIMVGQFRQMMSLGEIGANLDKYTAMMMGFPQKLDEVLTLAAEGGARMRLQVTDTAARRKQRNSLAIAVALLMILAAVALLAHHLATMSVAPAWVERVSALAFVMLGVILLRAVSR